MTVRSKAERSLARNEALANTRIEGHVPTPEFLAVFDAVVDGKMTAEQAIKASLARATGLPIPTNDKEYQALVEALDAILDAGGADETHALAGLAAMVGERVAAYEASRYPMSEAMSASLGTTRQRKNESE